MASLFGHDEHGQARGPLGAVKDVATTVVATLQTRLALLANEIQVEKIQLQHRLTLGLALVFCLGVGVLLAVALMVLVWWDQRLVVLGFFTALFLGVAAGLMVALRRHTAESSPLLSATVAELQKDLRHLQGLARREPEAR